MIIKEKLYYNAINIALNSDYRKIKALKTKSWEDAWLSIKNGFPEIDPQKEFEKIDKSGIKLILDDEEDFPKNLKEMPWPPLAIYIQGALEPIQSIAIVGTRKVTPHGKLLAKQIAKELSQSGIQIISGLAMGVDESAHSGALEGSGKTVAVLPTGLGNIYPRQNYALSQKIIKSGGALVSEFHFDYKPYISSFIQRNRIVSALSLAAIIIEAPERSGALATARFAIEQNREVLVVPGPADHPNYKGSHKLIREGAGLVTCASDILEDLGLKNEEPATLFDQVKNIKITDEEKTVLEAINQLGWPVSVDKISEATKIQVQKANQIIAFLTIKGILK
ncbi:MAG: DNA-processing protein DprA [bacterium]|nr:DNA-processing protein DprA [bacterium]